MGLFQVVHWSKAIPNVKNFMDLIQKLVDKLEAELLPLRTANAGSWTEGGEHLFSAIRRTPDNRINPCDIKCMLEDMGIGGHFDNALPCPMTALYGPGQRLSGEREHMKELESFSGLADEWWFIPITGGAIKELEQTLKPESKENLLRANKEFGLLIQEDPHELRYDVMKQGRLYKGDNEVELE